MPSGIYKIINMKNDKYYIGSSIDIYKRFDQHEELLYLNKHHNKHLQRAWNKYGYQSFVFEIIELCEKDKCKELEQKYLDYQIGEYNINKCANGWNYKHIPWNKGLTKHTDERIREYGEKQKGNKNHMYGKTGSMLGKKHTEETKNKISYKMKKLESYYWSGKTLSEEHKNNISKSQKNRWLNKNAR